MDDIIDWSTLEGLASKQAIETAKGAMDVSCVTHFKYDKRGRLEAGVKPAPPSTEPASYVKITRRGARFLVDCRKHGRGTWCIHGLILALHHLGHEPVYRVAEVAPVNLPVLGYQLVVAFTQNHLSFSIRQCSDGGFVPNPQHFLNKNGEVLGLNQEAINLFGDLAELENGKLIVSLNDGASLLWAMGQVELFTKDGSPIARVAASPPMPRIQVALRNQALHWQADQPIKQGSVFLRGWPGYVIVDDQLGLFRGYVPDFNGLVGNSGKLPLNPEHLQRFLHEKHQVTWTTPKPEVVEDLDHIGLKLGHQGNDLMGQLGLWQNDHFFPLKDGQAPNQVITSGKRTLLLRGTSWQMSHLERDRQQLRAPWQRGTSFRIREQQAGEFLQDRAFPTNWQVDRRKADHWFGITSLETDCTWADGTPTYRIGEQLFDHNELMDGLLENGSGVRLSEGRVLRFDTTQLRANQHVLQGVAELHEDKPRRNQLIARILGEETEPPQACHPNHTWQQMLRPYQLEGVNWMLSNFAREEPALLADDMGLGKTIQTLATLDTIKEDLPQLVVVPTSLLDNWQREAANFCKHRVITLHHGPKRATTAAPLTQADLVITSYGTVRRDIELLYDVQFQVVVLDEAQAIKNASSQVARAVAELWCDHRLALTGTPVENRLTELWAIFRFLAPGYLGEEADMKAITLPGTAAFEGLKLKVGPFLKRRLKSEVEPDLPEKQEITVKLPMSDAQSALYAQYLKGSIKDIQAGKTQTMSILTKLLRLRQVCCHPGLVDEGRIAQSSNKFEYLLEQLDEVVGAGHGCLVFSQFTSLLQLLRFALEEKDLPCFYLDGATRNRQELVDRFQAGEVSVFLISLKAGGTGLNLTRASYVYHLDPWWNPMVEAQATDRAHRIGQTQKVFSYKIISEGTIEDKILSLQAGKKFLAEGLWQEPEKLFERMDKDTLMGLLQ